jgi:hypothetical protein
MEHERGAFKVNREFAPSGGQKEPQRLNLKPNRASNSLDMMPKICAGSLVGCHICLRINRFASKAYIFFAQVLGNTGFLQVEDVEFFNEAICLPQ